jgi:hypothetical protein
MATVDERVFLVAMSRLASNHTGTGGHLQRMIQSLMGYGDVSYIPH